MTEKQRSVGGTSILIALSVAAIIAALLGPYVAGYFWLGQYSAYFQLVGGTPRPPLKVVRVYRQKWLAAAFSVAASTESWLCGTEVQILWSDQPLP